MNTISTHVLDAVLGKPASGIAVRLEKQTETGWLVLSESATDSDGRCPDLCQDGSDGVYRLTFAVDDYFAIHSRISIYPEISITFLVEGDHYHIPLLLSDNSYTTYRGS